MNRAKRDKYTMAIMFLDIDRFKPINDSLGHHAGDEMLRIFTRRLNSIIRESDLLFRIGGDEFTIISKRIVDHNDAAHLAERIVQAMGKPVDLEGHSKIVTVSIGISIYPKDNTAAEKLVNNADSAMYQSKQNGRNQYSFYEPEMN